MNFEYKFFLNIPTWNKHNYIIPDNKSVLTRSGMRIDFCSPSPIYRWDIFCRICLQSIPAGRCSLQSRDRTRHRWNTRIGVCNRGRRSRKHMAWRRNDLSEKQGQVGQRCVLFEWMFYMNECFFTNVCHLWMNKWLNEWITWCMLLLVG